MNIAVISNGTFSENHYKEYFNSCEDTKLMCVCSIDDKLPKEQYDVIAIDYYNEKLNTNKLNYLSEQHPESIFIILADVDFENDDFKKEEKILKKFHIYFATCYNIKTDDGAKDFYYFAQEMINVKNDSADIEFPLSANVIMWISIFLAIVALGLIHYLH